MTFRVPDDLRRRFPRLIGESGGFTMLANDQRESLRTILARGRSASEVTDEEIRQFKRSVVRTLTPYASAVLIDRPYGITATLGADVAPGCGVIVAADVLHQQPGSLVTGSHLDPLVTAEYLRATGAAAAKLLVIWTQGGAHPAEDDMIDEFIGLCADAGVSSLVEGIVRPSGERWTSAEDRHDAVQSAAVEICRHRPDIYKAEVPGYIAGDLSRVVDHSARLTAAIDTPWVVLSNGVEAHEFADAVREAVRGGADGFLAGRGVWAAAAASDRPDEVLAEVSVPRLQQLGAIVAEERVR